MVLFCFMIYFFVFLIINEFYYAFFKFVKYLFIFLREDYTVKYLFFGLRLVSLCRNKIFLFKIMILGIFVGRVCFREG